MKRIKLYLIIALSSLGFISCEDWLSLHPDNAQTSDQYWQSKQDVESVVAAGYVKLRECVKDQSLFVWGEMRGECITIINSSLNDEIKAAQKIRNVDIEPNNKYASWSNMYKVIGMANSVLKYAPSVRNLDPSFSLGEMNGYFSEAYFLRSLAYFYLVRTFKEVPLILEPYVEDTQDFSKAKSSEDEVLAQIITDLKKALESAKTFYPETNDAYPLNTKGRATKWSINALLADVYLWRGQVTGDIDDYQSCINACNQVMGEGSPIRLLSGDEWFSNYFPGNSNESIFEVQFSYDKKQTNSFRDWFGIDYTKVTYIVSAETEAELFYESTLLGDKRGEYGSYVGNYLWKYLGFNYYNIEPAARGGAQNDQNFIIYRLADVYLMKAEAYIMKNDYENAMKLITDIRSRAGILMAPSMPQNELEMLDLLLNERSRELLGEGKRWFDLLRVARRHDYRYKEYMIEHVLTAISPGTASIARAKLADPYALYLPIHKDELTANSSLLQNPYYDSLGK